MDRLTPAKEAANLYLNREVPKGSARDPLRGPCNRLTLWVFDGLGGSPNVANMVETLIRRFDAGGPRTGQDLASFVRRTAKQAVEAGIQQAYGDAHRREVPGGLLKRLATLDA